MRLFLIIKYVERSDEFMKEKFINAILNNELKTSMGCTEPSAIAYSIAFSKKYLLSNDSVKLVELNLSSNLIKNVLCVTIPNTKQNGIVFAAIAGLVVNNDAKGLHIFRNLTKENIEQILEMQKNIKVKIKLVDNVSPLFVKSTLITQNGHSITTIITNQHDYIQSVIVDGKELFINNDNKEIYQSNNNIEYKDIFRFVENDFYDIELVKIIEKYNTDIGNYGMNNDVGLNIGKSIKKVQTFNENISDVVAKTVSAIDSRMSGVSKTVVINSGSGNQGITATIPIIEMAKVLKVSDRVKNQSLILSHLTAIYIRSKQSRLSSTCGAVFAACGVAAGLTYMLGGGLLQIERAVLNLLCSNFGILCDGAKTTCSLKVMSVLSSAINCAYLSRNDVYIDSNLGIISTDFEKTIMSISLIEKKLTKGIDKIIMREAMKNCFNKRGGENGK